MRFNCLGYCFADLDHHVQELRGRVICGKRSLVIHGLPVPSFLLLLKDHHLGHTPSKKWTDERQETERM